METATRRTQKFRTVSSVVSFTVINVRPPTVKSVIERQKHNLELKMNVLTQLDKDSVDMIQQNEIVKRDAKRFADGLIKSIQAKLKNIITTAENQTKKSLESLKAKRSEIQHQINVMKSSLEEAEKRLKRSTTRRRCST